MNSVIKYKINFKKLIITFLLFLFHSFNLLGQEIKTEIEKFKYCINDTIEISYQTKRTIDSVKMEGRYFRRIGGPSENSQYDENKIYTSTLRFSFKPLKPGRLKIPKLIVFSESKKIQSEDLFIEIVGKEFTSEDLKPIEYEIGHTFTVNLPDYMNRTSGINDYSAIEYKNEKEDVYGYVIAELKENIGNLPASYAVKTYYEDRIKQFMIKEENRKVSKPQFLKKGDINFIETDMTLFDKEHKKTLYFFIGIAETNKAFYRFISWTSEVNHDKFKGDFQNILYSLED